MFNDSLFVSLSQYLKKCFWVSFYNEKQSETNDSYSYWGHTLNAKKSGICRWVFKSFILGLRY